LVDLFDNYLWEQHILGENEKKNLMMTVELYQTWARVATLTPIISRYL